MRQSVFSGLFYPKEKKQLEETIINSLKNLQAYKHKTKAIIAPHAGYIYCKKQLAEAYNTLKAVDFKTAVIIGPSHRHFFNGVSVYDGQGYQFPTGSLFISKKIISNLKKENSQISYIPNAHSNEHSIEVHLPFLHHVNKEVELVPLITGKNTIENLELIAQNILNVIDIETSIFIVSTDFSHFFSSKIAKKMDQQAIELILKQDHQGLYNNQKNKQIQLCGIDATLIVLKILRKLKINKIEHFSYSHSGQVSKDESSVVGYNSFCAYE